MKLRNACAALGFALLVACTTATPYTPTTAERSAMQARVTSFTSDFRNGRVAAVVDVVPPKVTAGLAQRAGIPVALLRKGVIEQTKAATERVKIVSYGMATERAVFQQTTSGRAYALIPTQTVVRAPNGRTVQSNNTTLAFEDAGTWYLVRIDEAIQRELLLEAYPDFKGLTVTDGVTKVIG